MPQSLVGLRVVHAVGDAQECIMRLSVIPLLLQHRMEGGAHGLYPEAVEGGPVACLTPVAIGQTQGVAKGVELVLSFEHARAHLCPVGGPVRTHGCGRKVVGIGIGIQENGAELAPQQASDEPCEAVVLPGQAQVGPHLGRTVSQPQGGYVAGDDEGVGRVGPFHGCVERTRKALFEHGPELGVADARSCLGYAGLYGGGDELAVGRCRTLRTSAERKAEERDAE